MKSDYHDLYWICCLTCDRIQNRIWTWTLLSLKIKHPFHLMVNFPLSNHHFQNAHLTNLTFIDIYEIPMYLNEIWDENVKISFLNDPLPWIWIILMNRIPVRLTLALVLQLTHFALASLNYVIFVIITQYLITERLNDGLVIGSERVSLSGFRFWERLWGVVWQAEDSYHVG